MTRGGRPYTQTRQEILDYLEHNPNTGSQVISEAIGMTRHNTSRYLSRMKKEGVVILGILDKWSLREGKSG